MSDLLNPAFVEHHISQFHGPMIPPVWGLDTYGVYYQLDLKMCQLRSLDYSFNWGDERKPVPRVSSVLEMPSKIIKLDVSLNELTSISHEGLFPFKNLRALDASLNQIRQFQGVEVLHHLYHLNLSHNNIKRVEGLLNSYSLGELNLSNNVISDISGIPSLINLRILNLNKNKLLSLVGVSSFPKLEEIYLDDNQVKDLTPLTSCLHISVVSAANNNIQTLDSVLRLLKSHMTIQSLNLAGNPVEKEHTYQSDILRSANITMLDNVAVRPMPTVLEDHTQHVNNLYTLRDAAKQAFEDRLRVAKERMDSNISFLQKRIVDIQKEYKDFEKKTRADLDACLRYLDSLGEVELASIGHDPIGASFHPSDRRFLHPWQENFSGNHKAGSRKPKNDYSSVKATDEVLRYAFKELVKQNEQH